MVVSLKIFDVRGGMFKCVYFFEFNVCWSGLFGNGELSVILMDGLIFGVVYWICEVEIVEDVVEEKEKFSENVFLYILGKIFLIVVWFLFINDKVVGVLKVDLFYLRVFDVDDKVFVYVM